ncbi:MAG: hypothetical protein CL624_08990 [Arcobacter sp.]|nr:hypothetical protein [Arcobacter sp.]|tara:strand:+ start:1648 stop:2097 length:450 start_codon:yes stop_codon:yes gene_type:complete
MGIFDIFKKKPKFVDDLFGEMGYTKLKDSSKNFYDGEVHFQGKLIAINLDADENGPTDEQKDFFRKLDKEYDKIKESIILPFLKKELEDNIEDAGLNDFDNEFDFDGISIGRIKNDKTEWSITYDSKPMRHNVSIDFEGMEPKYMTVDG